MKSFVYIVLLAFLGTVTVQAYGPKIHSKPHRGSHKSSHGSHHRPHHGSHHGSHHRPSHDHSFKPSHHDQWDNSPVWDDRSDPWVSREDSYQNYSPEDSYDPDSYSSEEFGRPNEDYGDWYDHFRSKRPCKRPNKKPKPKPTTSTPMPTTHRLPPTQATILPLTPDTRPTPRPFRTTTQFTSSPIRTVPPTPRPTNTMGPTRTTWRPTTHTEDTTHWETTTLLPETTTTTNEEEFTTISPEVQTCIDACHSTPEYNPVCGTNGQTFDNEGKLFCASSCGVNVSLRRRSVCPPPTFDYDYTDTDNEERTTPPPTTTTTPAYMGRTTPLSSFQRCMRLCRITASFTPVCGTDLITYMNMDRLKCAQSCGEDVKVLCEKPCAACGFNPVTPKTTTLPPTTTGHGRTTLEPDLLECINACPVTAEYNPVCGSDHVTYINPSHMICAQLCGIAVSVVRLSPCPPRTTTSTTTEPAPPTLSPSVLSCIRSCPVTTEFDPVCGSDDLTYHNLGNLECSRFCGVEVELKYKSRCIDEFDLGPDGNDNTTTGTTQNGNKDVTKPSKSTETTTSLFTSPTTTPYTTLTTTVSTTPSTLPTTLGPISTSTLGFTIPPDVLNEIFGLTSTQSPTKKPTNSDEDEDLDLDARYGTDNDTDNDRRHRIIFPE